MVCQRVNTQSNPLNSNQLKYFHGYEQTVRGPRDPLFYEFAYEEMQARKRGIDWAIH